MSEPIGSGDSGVGAKGGSVRDPGGGRGFPVGGITALVILLLLTVVSVLLSVRFGSVSMSTADVVAALMGRGPEAQRWIVFDYRLPRALQLLLRRADTSLARVEELFLIGGSSGNWTLRSRKK